MEGSLRKSHGDPRVSFDGRASVDGRMSIDGRDTRVSFDERPRMSIEERRGDAGKTSFEYARRSRQSADIKRVAPVAGRPSFDVKGRLSLDPELFHRGSRKDWGASQKRSMKPLTGCVLVLHGDVTSLHLVKSAQALGATVLPSITKDVTHLITSEVRFPYVLFFFFFLLYFNLTRCLLPIRTTSLLSRL
jgi:hypothetical protein